MKTTIREATLNDLPNVQSLNLELFKKEYAEYDPLLNLQWTFGEQGTAYYVSRIESADAFVLVAEHGKEFVGYLCGGIANAEAYREMPLVSELENMFVQEPFRSQGIGKQLCDAFVDWCTKKGVGKVRVSATAQNELAIQFYRNNGFKDYTLILEKDLM